MAAAGEEQNEEIALINQAADDDEAGSAENHVISQQAESSEQQSGANPTSNLSNLSNQPPPPAAHLALPSDRPDSAARLNQLEAQLRQPDAVNEPSVLNLLREYVVANGHPQQAVELLTENYVGYPQIATLACSWLKFLDDEDEDGSPGEYHHHHHHRNTNTNNTNNEVADTRSGKKEKPKSQNRGIAAAPLLSHQNESVAVGKAASPSPPTLSAMDEAFFLRKLVLERFDPQMFAGIFSAGGSGIPQWINALLADADGRALIYELSSRYQNSLLLNFAMQKIIMQPGRDAEAAASGVSLVGYFGVYHRLLGVRLRQAAAARDEETLLRVCRELCEGAALSQHAYVHAQQMLLDLARDSSQPYAPRFLRISQELEAAIPGPAPWKMHRWFECEAAVDVRGGNTTLNSSSSNNNNNNNNTGGGGGGGGVNQDGDASAAAWLVSDILANTSGGNPATTSDVIKLFRLYALPPPPLPLPLPPSSENAQTAKRKRSADDGEAIVENSDKVVVVVVEKNSEKEQKQRRRPPSVHLLRQPRLIDALLQTVFAAGKQLQTEAQSAFIGLLSIAVAAADDDNDSDDDAVAAGEVNNDVSPLLHDNRKTPVNKQEAVIATRAALTTAAELAHMALGDEPLNEEHRRQADEAFNQPCCAVGVLCMLRSRLVSSEYWAAAYLIHKEPPFLPLLLSIVKQQPRFHSEILSLVGAVLGALGTAPSGPDVARGMLQVAVALAAAGRVKEVLDWSEKWSKNADATLIRHLFFGLLEIAAPPYSPRFAGAMVRLGAVGGALRQRMGGREWMARGALLAEFGGACGGAAASTVAFEPVLGRDEVSFLRELNLCLKTSGLLLSSSK